MYCPKCGTQLQEGVHFCPSCGNRIGEEVRTEEEQKMPSECEPSSGTSTSRAEYEEADSPAYEGAEISEPDQNGQRTASADSGQAEQGLARLWNSPLLNMVAVKFGNVLSIIEGIVFLILARILFGEGGFWGIAFGILFLVAAFAYVADGVRELVSRNKKELTEKELNKAKRNLCIGIPVIVIALLILLSTGGGIYSDVKAISFDSIGSETIGEIIDDNLKSAKWSKEKIDSGSYKVYVEGYSPIYDEDLRIGFYYESDGDSYEVTLQSIVFLDSGETYSDSLSAGIIWATFY
ncbi:MAG: zinc-ribbon domain-containing protein [Lachnospiraceae bacterium]|nr:zinc-ribbon domain-containing protein [Lachnospiraceae bacterium]